jgi:hypothetical protein
MKSFLQGKKNLSAEPLRPPPQFGVALTPRCDATRPAGSPASGGQAQSHVEVVKEGDKVVRLIVHCACGERVEIECLYSAGS